MPGGLSPLHERHEAGRFPTGLVVLFDPFGEVAVGAALGVVLGLLDSLREVTVGAAFGVMLALLAPLGEVALVLALFVLHAPECTLAEAS